MKPSFAHLEKYRYQAKIPLQSPRGARYGCFWIRSGRGEVIRIVAHDGTRCEGNEEDEILGWEHVSVSVLGLFGVRIPTWEEMCFVKELFWDGDECVVQFHPPKAEYVNFHPHTLHLWKYIHAEFPRPPSILVGPKLLPADEPTKTRRSRKAQNHT